MTQLNDTIPEGLCQCGCGQATAIAPYTFRAHGWVRGRPLRFVRGHSRKGRRFAPDPTTRYEVDAASGCWLWTGPKTRNGYGLANVGGRTVLAHRLFFERLVGPIPKGMQLDHVKARGCRHRSCVNPDHLEPVTNAQNAQRGKQAKLTPEDVAAIRSLAHTTRRRDIAARFGVSIATVERVIAGTAWRAG